MTYRPKVHQVSVKEEIRPTHYVDVVGVVVTTYKSPSVHNVDILTNDYVIVSIRFVFNDRLFYGYFSISEFFILYPNCGTISWIMNILGIEMFFFSAMVLQLGTFWSFVQNFAHDFAKFSRFWFLCADKF